MSKAKRFPKGTFAPQNSPLLNLPAELRNKIHEFVAADATSFSVRENRELYCPPFSLVCCQIRKEYKQIYLKEAPKYAPKIIIHITNFFFFESASLVENIIALGPEVQRTYLVRVFITNTWAPVNVRRICSRYVLNVPPGRWNYSPGDPVVRPYEYEIRFDSNLFDVHLCRQRMVRLDWCLRNHADPSRWYVLKKAFLEAFERYEAL